MKRLFAALAAIGLLFSCALAQEEAPPIASYVMPDGAQVFYSASGGSKELASGIQNTLRTALDPANQRLCKPADTVYLLEQCRCTGVLIECGFLSNPQEAQLLQTQDYQKKIVCAIAGGLAQFLEEGKRNEI